VLSVRAVVDAHLALGDDVQAVAQIAFAENPRAGREAQLIEHGADIGQHRVGCTGKDTDRAQHVEPVDRHHAHHRIHVPGIAPARPVRI